MPGYKKRERVDCGNGQVSVIDAEIVEWPAAAVLTKADAEDFGKGEKK